MPADQALAACPYCHQVVGAPASFSRLWHIGRDPNTPSCCLTGEYQRQAARQQAAPAPVQPAASGPINVAPRSGTPQRQGQTSPLVIVDESQLR